MLHPLCNCCGCAAQHAIGGRSEADQRRPGRRPGSHATPRLADWAGECAKRDLAWSHDDVAHDLGACMGNDHQLLVRNDLQPADRPAPQVRRSARLGVWWGADYVEAYPDMMGVGKGMSGGYAPLSALLLSERIASSFWGDESRKFDEGHTFNANPLSAAVGHAVLSYIIDNNLLDNARVVGARMLEMAQEVASRYDIFTEVLGVGLYSAMIVGRHPRRRQRQHRGHAEILEQAGDAAEVLGVGGADQVHVTAGEHGQRCHGPVSVRERPPTAAGRPARARRRWCGTTGRWGTCRSRRSESRTT